MAAIETIPIRGRALLLKLRTDEGIVGIGKPMNHEHGRVVAQAVAEPCSSPTYGTPGGLPK